MTKNEYDNLKNRGVLYELFPDATGNYEKDVDYVFMESRGERFVNPFDSYDSLTIQELGKDDAF